VDQAEVSGKFEKRQNVGRFFFIYFFGIDFFPSTYLILRGRCGGEQKNNTCTDTQYRTSEAAGNTFE